MTSPLVSIIIPVYNAERHLSECIESAINQTWPNKEIIIVDDGSTDGSLNIAHKYQCDTIKVLCGENAGASAARNKGLRIAKGDYIQFLDADDVLSLDKIQLQVETLAFNAGKIAVCSTVHFKNGKDYRQFKPSTHEEKFLIDADPVHFLINLLGGYSNHGSMVQPNAWLTPRTIINQAGLWNEALTLDDDGEFFCRVVLSSTGVLKTSGINYYRKYNENNSLSSGTDQKSLISLLNSNLSKKKHLLEKTNSYPALLATYKMFFNIMLNSYMRCPSIYNKAKKELPCIHPSSYRPSVGGPLANYLSRILGWKIIKFLQLKMKP